MEYTRLIHLAEELGLSYRAVYGLHLTRGEKVRGGIFSRIKIPESQKFDEEATTYCREYVAAWWKKWGKGPTPEACKGLAPRMRKAVRFVYEKLREGPLFTNEILGVETCFTVPSLRKAARWLGAIVYCEGSPSRGEGWVWEIPRGAPASGEWVEGVGVSSERMERIGENRAYIPVEGSVPKAEVAA